MRILERFAGLCLILSARGRVASLLSLGRAVVAQPHSAGRPAMVGTGRLRLQHFGTFGGHLFAAGGAGRGGGAAGRTGGGAGRAICGAGRGGGGAARGGGGGATRVACGRGGGSTRFTSGRICGCRAGRDGMLCGLLCVLGGVSLSRTAGFSAGCTFAWDCEG
jgi:hypothetical protein